MTNHVRDTTVPTPPLTNQSVGFGPVPLRSVGRRSCNRDRRSRSVPPVEAFWPSPCVVKPSLCDQEGGFSAHGHEVARNAATRRGIDPPPVVPIPESGAPTPRGVHRAASRSNRGSSRLPSWRTAQSVRHRCAVRPRDAATPNRSRRPPSGMGPSARTVPARRFRRDSDPKWCTTPGRTQLRPMWRTSFKRPRSLRRRRGRSAHCGAAGRNGPVADGPRTRPRPRPRPDLTDP